ncbi:MAG: hypothetical protein ACJA0M_000125 [Chitinophagales bacterium]|jgi:hypothetical protein
MFLDQFYTQTSEGIAFSAEQSSLFAKTIAGDFNVIHDPDSKRFCVPGDLLFAMVLGKYGLSADMHFDFEGMVGSDAPLIYPDNPDSEFSITNPVGKSFMSVTRSGKPNTNATMIEQLTREYVAFSGQNFPHILMPLMEKHNVIINPARPLVIYESMTLALETVNLTNPTLGLNGSELEVNGKRGDVKLHFVVKENGVEIGQGYKKLVLSGLREYDKDTAQSLINLYETLKANFYSKQS